MKIPALIVLSLLPLAGHGQTGLPAKPAPAATFVPATEAVSLLASAHHIVLDVRTPQEFATGYLQGAKNIDYRAPDFEAQLTRLNPNASYLLYCASGNRSGQAVALMHKKGFKKVVNIGGYKNLKDADADSSPQLS